MPTVIQICVEGNTGSTGRIAEGIGVAAMARGWKSYIAYGRFPRPSRSSLIRIGSQWDVWAHGLQTRLLDRHCLASKSATKKLVGEIVSLKPDIVHLHHLHGYYINIKILFDFLLKFRVPIVWTFHDCWALTGHCAYFSFARCDRWMSECYSCPQKREYPASYGIDRSRSNYHEKKELFTSAERTTIVPASQWLNEIVGRSFLARLPRRVINNGVDLGIFKPAEIAPKSINGLKIGDRFLLLGVANTWGTRKGLKDFIRLSEIISDREVIVLVGLNSSETKRLPKSIIGLARTESQQQLCDLYGAAGTFINPSWEDNFPTTNLEALACGTPVITYKTGGSVEAVSERTGYIVEQGDVAGLYRAVETVKSIGKEAFSSACRDRAVKFYNKDDRYADYVDLYEEIMESPRPDNVKRQPV
jgi:putative colanic acid biosynthesis glycosyltransferase